MTQTAANVLVAINRETTIGTVATVTSADRLRIIESPGLVFRRAPVISQEKRADGVMPMPRLGGKSVDGSYNTELTVGGAIDKLLESVMRSTWVAAVAITEATMTSITTTTSTIVAAGGSWITQGVRVGDVVRLTNHATAANNSINLRVVTVTASTITVAGTPLVLNASADSAFTLTILKKLKTNTSGPTRYSYSVEQYDTDVDLSEVFLGNRAISVRMRCAPGQQVQITWGFLGMDRNQLAAGASPFFTSPSVTTGDPLIADDAAIYYNGAAVTTFTGFDLEFIINAAGQPVIGSLVGPNIYDNDLLVRGSISGIRADFANLTLFSAETEFSMGIMFTAPGTAPVDTMSIWLPRVKIMGLSAPAGGGDGAKIETKELAIATAVATSSVDATVAVICSSGA